uniref:G_PROTEIN_RECEP_F1_2 domain-containing protein n=1 Tax=Toxocara canis TaxID=6265 RepID=A0A183USR8_TOXCA
LLMVPLSYILQWGGVLPPFHKFGVFVICGFELFASSLSMAIGQKYYDLCTILFPVATKMFDDTRQKKIPGFVWTSDERRILRLHEHKLLILWFTSTAVVIMSMALIVPFFFKFGKEKHPNRCFNRRTIMWLLAILFIVMVLANSAIILWLFLTAPDDHRLFYSLFDGAVKEEIFLTEIEKGLDCISDDDKELSYSSDECDNSINRSVISRKLLTPLLYFWVVGHCLAFIIFGFANKGNLKSCSLRQVRFQY